MKILDLTAGARAIWFDKKNPLCTYLDRRPEVSPDIICDTTELPPEVGTDYDLIVYDPPHMNCGPKSNFSKVYGYHHTFEILENICKTGKEAHRVSKPGALMALKWNTHDIKLTRIFKLLGDWEPLFGNVTKFAQRRQGQTLWVMLRRRD
jgi:hypothetical protein